MTNNTESGVFENMRTGARVSTEMHTPVLSAFIALGGAEEQLETSRATVEANKQLREGFMRITTPPGT
jgi:hypothetical protein